MNTAKYLILGTLVVWLVVDILLDRNRRPTISKTLLQATRFYGIPIVAIIFFVLGHIFWPQYVTEPPPAFLVGSIRFNTTERCVAFNESGENEIACDSTYEQWLDVFYRIVADKKPTEQINLTFAEPEEPSEPNNP